MLDQYELFQTHHKINPEPLLIKSQSTFYRTLKSFSKRKFITMVESNQNQQLCKLLFADQSQLAHIKGTEETTFFKIIKTGSYFLNLTSINLLKSEI
ncbi:hypothetical protein D3X11_06725 [Streptococcus sp. X16XC17]|nr:hypothetical protein D3X11_06725 [Streptococcus sp. X16XC17]